jgi:hypothetical protein
VTALEPGVVPVASPLLAAALDYASRGWAVLPLRVAGPKPDGRKDVRLPKAWDRISTTDPDVIRSWFGPGGAWESGSVAVDTGKSGLVVVDLDMSGEKNGFQAWAAVSGDLARLAHKTPSNGLHLFFRADPARPVGIDSKAKIAPGIDIRGIGGLVIMPPSSDWRGAYEVTRAADWANLTPVPDIVAERVPLGGQLAPPPSTTAVNAQRDPSGMSVLVTGDGVPKYTKADADRRITGALRRARDTPEGQGFNHALNEAAYELGHWVGGGYIPEADAESLLSYVVTQVFPHGPNGDDLKTITSGLTSGMAKPYEILPGLVSALAPETTAWTPELDDAFQQEVAKAYWRLKANQAARDQLAAENIVGDGDGKVDWDALDRPPKPVCWQVPELIAAGRSYAIVGGPKSGKSTTARHLVVRAAEAGHKVLYLDRENTWDEDWVGQLRGMGVTKTIQSHLDVRMYPAIPPLDTEAGGDKLIEWVKETGAEIVCLDMFLRFLAGKENDSDTFNAFDRHTGQRLRAMGVTLIRLDHSGKSDADGPRGSSGKSGDVDVQWMLTREGARVTLDPKGISRKGDQRGAVTLIVRDGRLVPVDGSTPDLKTVTPNDEIQTLLGRMLDDGTITLKTSASVALTKLAEMGKGLRKAEFVGTAGQWVQFKASRGDGAAIEVLKQTNRSKGFNPTFLTGSQDQQTPHATKDSDIADDLEKGSVPTVPGTGSHDRGTAGTVPSKKQSDLGKQRFPRSGNRREPK